MDKSGTVKDTFFRQLVEQSGELILGLALDGTLMYCSPSFAKVIGLPAESLLDTTHKEYLYEKDRYRFQQHFDDLIEQNKPFALEYRYKLQDRTGLWVEGKAGLIFAGSEPVGVGLMARDIRRFKNIEENLTRMAYYDALTGLPNRRLFQDRYRQSMLLAKRYRRKLAVLYLDLDEFKAVNDEYGHHVGDELLKTVAARLQNCVRDPDTVCRLGGDEFVILLQQFEQTEDMEKAAQRVLDAMNSRFVIGQHEISIKCSMGAAFYPQNGDEDEDLVQSADHAMYQAKKHGKNYSQFKLS